MKKSLPVRERGLKRTNHNIASYHPKSLPVRERGLKQLPPDGNYLSRDVAPRAGAWIETDIDINKMLEVESLPVRERGLKHAYSIDATERTMSLPVRERGLKQTYMAQEVERQVAPRAGAWIETVNKPQRKGKETSLPVRERGLKPIQVLVDLWK
ncbi:MAG: hypothetical protein SRB2_04346 [Desulfobacteraceae bacterium Eth-SRB2]|nr:MAG: hypothetical protein SRB2_04346 [Desulfobacteraceae bacterium Eth-SRB2]